MKTLSTNYSVTAASGRNLRPYPSWIMLGFTTQGESSRYARKQVKSGISWRQILRGRIQLKNFLWEISRQSQNLGRRSRDDLSGRVLRLMCSHASRLWVVAVTALR